MAWLASYGYGSLLQAGPQPEEFRQEGNKRQEELGQEGKDHSVAELCHVSRIVAGAGGERLEEEDF